MIDEVISGQVSSHAAGRPPITPGSAPLSVFGQRFSSVRPRVLHLGVPSQQYDEQGFGHFPANDYPKSYLGGVSLAAADAWEVGKDLAYQSRRYAAAVLTYGVGAASHTVYFDWRPGVYNLAPCSYVDLGVLPYGGRRTVGFESEAWDETGPFGPAVFSASCAPGFVAEAPPPTLTTESFVEPDGEVKLGMRAPTRARAVDCYQKRNQGSDDPDCRLVLTCSNGGVVIRDYAAGVFWPPGPADVVGDLVGLVPSGESDGPIHVGVRFYLSL